MRPWVEKHSTIKFICIHKQGSFICINGPLSQCKKGVQSSTFSTPRSMKKGSISYCSSLPFPPPSLGPKHRTLHILGAGNTCGTLKWNKKTLKGMTPDRFPWSPRTVLLKMCTLEPQKQQLQAIVGSHHRHWMTNTPRWFWCMLKFGNHWLRDSSPTLIFEEKPTWNKVTEQHRILFLGHRTSEFSMCFPILLDPFMDTWDFITRGNLIFNESGWKIPGHHRGQETAVIVWG